MHHEHPPRWPIHPTTQGARRHALLQRIERERAELRRALHDSTMPPTQPAPLADPIEPPELPALRIVVVALFLLLVIETAALAYLLQRSAP